MARRPGTIALVAALICALGGIGFVRFGVDAGPDLLVGQDSHAKQVYDRFSSNFGADPIVVVLALQNHPAFYIEKNLLRLGALESDLARDSRVATVLGPGTVAGSAQEAAAGEVARVRDEYPYFVAETVLASAIQKGQTDPNQLSQIESNAYQAAQVAMAADIVKASEDADAARADYDKHPEQHSNDQVLRGRELAAEAAASKTEAPPFFANYIAGPAVASPDTKAAQQLFAQLAAGYGDCSGEIASVLHINPTCQVFLERLFLDLPNCPKISSHQFCSPKQQWAAVLPRPKPGDPGLAVITVRLKPGAVGHADEVNALVAKIRDELSHGQPHSSNPVTRSLGAFAPTECGTPDTSSGQPDACQQRYHDAAAAFTIAGAPLLVQGVAGTLTHLLLALFPVAFLVMLLLLLGAFRVRGRIWPLVGAGGAALLTIGGGLLLGVSISPAVLAGVPVLVGLGVDYAVQLVARFSEERRRGLGLEAALRLTLGNTGPATMIAGTATLAGVAALAVITAVDLGPISAVPLVAEFALVLCAGVVFSWLAAVFVALPAATWGERRREARGELLSAAGAAAAEAPEAPRTAALASRWRAVLIPTALLAVAGWALMPRIPVETGVEKLLAPSLTELRDIDTVRGAIGYDNEIDFAVEGNVAGSDHTATVPDTVVWMARAGLEARCVHPGDVALAITIGDVFTASSQGGTSTSCASLQNPAPGSSPSPSAPASPSPAASPSPSSSPAPASPAASGSPSALRPSPTPGARVDGDVVRAGRAVLAATTPTAAPSAAAATPAPSSAGTSPASPATPAPTPAITRPDASGTFQTAFLCNLRLLPPLARNLVGPLSFSTQPCPVRDLYRNVFLGEDPSPVSPTMARIALGVRLTSVADQAKLIDQVTGEIGTPPAGMKVTPTGLTALAAQAYDTLTSRILWLNLVPLAVVALVLLAIFREPRRALLPVLPAALAAGWSSLIVDLLGHLPGAAGTALGSLNPLTVVLGALVIALGTEFGVVLLQRFYEERAAGREPDEAAGAALHGVGRAVLVSAMTLGAGFAVLAVSGPFPGGMPLIADFGLAVLIDLALAVGAVFLVMLPLAVALERFAPLSLPAPVTAGGGFRARQPQAPRPPKGTERAARRARAAEAAAARAAARAAATGEAAVAVAEPEAEREDEPEPEYEPEAEYASEAEYEPEAEYQPEPEFEPGAETGRRQPQFKPAAETGRREPQYEPAAEAQPATWDVPQIDQQPRGDEELAAPPQVPAAPPPATDPSAAGPRRFPGVSGRRHAAPVPPPPAAEPPARAEAISEPSPGTPPRLPGMSGRRRARPAADATAPPAPPSPAPRRMPGGITRRVTATPPQPPPPAAPPAPTADAQPHQGPGGPPPDDPRPPRQPGSGRSRRRRPPPWMRHQNPPGGGGGKPPAD